MCMIDYSDRATSLTLKWPVASVMHKCDECRRLIVIGEKYLYETYAFEGTAHTHKTCKHCYVVRDWLTDECGGFVYHGLRDDIADHAAERYPFQVKLLAIGMSVGWTRKDGLLWRIPKKPPVT